MKFLKIIFILCITLSITSCSDTDNTPNFTLSTANLAGTYSITSFSSLEIESATSSAGVTSELSRNNKVGDTFQVSFVLKTNGTYTAIGEYRSVSTVTPTPKNGQADPKIIVLNSGGTYKLDSNLNTINFTQSSGNFIDGSFDIKTFTENNMNVNQEVTETDGGITNEINTTITFTRE